MKNIALIIFLLCECTIFCFAQKNNSTVSGTLKESTGEPIPFATVYIDKTPLSATTTETGKFIIADVPDGNHILVFSAVGFIQTKKEIHTPLSKELSISLAQNVATLGELVVTGKSETQTVRELSYAVNVLDIKKYANATSDINQLLNKSTGVKIREEGGLGSNFNFSLNGFSGSRVRFFLDGVPMTNFGSSLGLNNIPINMAERIEVYKGVVPIWLGADALGGAVNIVTNQKVRNFVDASYSYGSFNTHRASVNTRFTDSSGFTTSANIFYNYSDNNFFIEAQDPDPKTGQFGELKKYRHFHDRYRSAAAIVEAGLVGKKWADKFLVGVMFSGNDKQIQQGATMQKVIGEAFTTSQSFIPTLKYQKKEFLLKKLDVSLFSSFNISLDQSIDTSAKKFRWDGSYTYSLYGDKSKQGEFKEKVFYIYKGRNLLNTANLNYTVNNNHAIAFNYTGNYYVRKEEERMRPYREGLISPEFATHIMGLGYKLTALHEKLSVNVFGKYFIRNSSMNLLKGEYDDEGKDVVIKNKFGQPGFGAAVSYFILPVLQVKTSYENTYRLPEAEELLGDGLLVAPNPLLRPEQSKNFNAELLATAFETKRHRIIIEAGYIYRDAFDFIGAKGNGPVISYQNLNSVKVNGVEGGIRYMFNDLFFVETNATYQNMVSTNKFDPPLSNIPNYQYKLRLPNIPYLFGNGSLSYNFKRAFSQHDNLSLSYTCSYVKSFYLFWSKLGSPETKREIPSQFIQGTSLCYSMLDGRYNVSFECQNLLNVKAYDYFYVQKPGRMLFIKLRYFFKK